MLEQDRKHWNEANKAIPKCERCKSWSKIGLSNRCLECDKLIILLYEKLKTRKQVPYA